MNSNNFKNTIYLLMAVFVIVFGTIFFETKDMFVPIIISVIWLVVFLYKLLEK